MSTRERNPFRNFFGSSDRHKRYGIIKPAGKPTLVPASDKRPAITSANTDFHEIQED